MGGNMTMMFNVGFNVELANCTECSIDKKMNGYYFTLMKLFLWDIYSCVIIRLLALYKELLQ